MYIIISLYIKQTLKPKAMPSMIQVFQLYFSLRIKSKH